MWLVGCEMLQKLMCVAVLTIGIANTASAATVGAITEGRRATVDGTLHIEMDAPGRPTGYALMGGAAIGAGDSFDIHGRIVGHRDFYSFTAATDFTISWIFDGYYVGGTSVADSGLVLEGARGGNKVKISLWDASGTRFDSIEAKYRTDVTSGDPMIFSTMSAGSYVMKIHSVARDPKPALYDIRIEVAPLPATGLLLLAGLGALAFRRRRRA